MRSTRIAQALQREASHARTCLLRLRMFERHRQFALSDLRPGGVCSAAADGSDRSQRRRSQFCELAVGQCFDLSDAFKDRLKERRVVFGPRLEPRGKFGIVDGEAFAGAQKRIIAQSRWVLRLHARRKLRKTVARKELLDDLAAGIRGAPSEPVGANPMTIDSKLRGEDWVIAQKLDNQCRSERGHAVARRRGAGCKKRGAAVRRSGMNNR